MHASADSAPGVASFSSLPLVMLSMNAFCLLGSASSSAPRKAPVTAAAASVGSGFLRPGNSHGVSPEIRTGAS